MPGWITHPGWCFSVLTLVICPNISTSLHNFVHSPVIQILMFKDCWLSVVSWFFFIQVTYITACIKMWCLFTPSMYTLKTRTKRMGEHADTHKVMPTHFFM